MRLHQSQGARDYAPQHPSVGQCIVIFYQHHFTHLQLFSIFTPFLPPMIPWRILYRIASKHEPSTLRSHNTSSCAASGLRRGERSSPNVRSIRKCDGVRATRSEGLKIKEWEVLNLKLLLFVQGFHLTLSLNHQRMRASRDARNLWCVCNIVSA